LSRDLGLSRPRFGEGYALEEAFHPLIENPVKNSFALDETHRLLLISGPNMGGKTALLKTLGLAVLMAQSGLFVAAKRATLAWPDRVYADIGDEQSLQESLSTFAGHLKRLKEMLEGATERSLVPHRRAGKRHRPRGGGGPIPGHPRGPPGPGGQGDGHHPPLPPQGLRPGAGGGHERLHAL
jgi:DNA mismatch repair protein MutS2